MLYKPGYKVSLEYKEFEIWCVQDWLSLRLQARLKWVSLRICKENLRLGKLRLGKVEISKLEIGRV